MNNKKYYNIDYVINVKISPEISPQTRAMIYDINNKKTKFNKGEISILVKWSDETISYTDITELNSDEFKLEIIQNYINPLVVQHNSNINTNDVLLIICRTSNTKKTTNNATGQQGGQQGMQTRNNTQNLYIQNNTNDKSLEYQLKSGINFAKLYGIKIKVLIQNGISGGYKPITKNKKVIGHDYAKPNNFNKGFDAFIGGFSQYTNFTPELINTTKKYYKDNNIKAFYAMSVDRLSRTVVGYNIIRRMYNKINIPMYFGDYNGHIYSLYPKLNSIEHSDTLKRNVTKAEMEWEIDVDTAKRRKPSPQDIQSSETSENMLRMRNIQLSQTSQDALQMQDMQSSPTSQGALQVQEIESSPPNNTQTNSVASRLPNMFKMLGFYVFKLF